jgi:hypothetical protein
MLSPEKIKPFLLHPERVVREFVVDYFKDSFSRDQELMPLILRCCDVHPGEKEVRYMLANANQFIQTEETITEIFVRLSSDPKNCNYYEKIIIDSSLELLDKYRNRFALLSNQGRKMAERRLLLKEMATEELWKGLMAYGHDNAGKYVNQFDYKYGECMAYELANRLDVPHDAIIERLKNPFPDDYEGYEGIYLNVLVGEMRLKDAIPVWLEHLRIEADLLNETAEYGLIKVGSAEVIRAIGNYFAGEEWGFRLYASGVLENIRLPESEELLCQLLPEEEDLSIATILAAGLCRMLSVNGIRLVKDMIIEGYDEQMLSLEEYLYANCRINNIVLPEMEEWREMIVEQTARNDHQYYENFLPEAAATAIPRKSEKIGRNDPCPCGSGKKFKKCCLLKQI